jgi:hypothetical protein
MSADCPCLSLLFYGLLSAPSSTSRSVSR